MSLSVREDAVEYSLEIFHQCFFVFRCGLAMIGCTDILPSELLLQHWGNQAIASVHAKQPWNIW